jgi:hypothetical protein
VAESIVPFFLTVISLGYHHFFCLDRQKNIKRKEGYCIMKVKKPFYKKVWFWILGIIFLAIVGSGLSGGEKKETEKIDYVTMLDSSSRSDSKQSPAPEQPADTTSAFTAKDVSDETIKSIKTYEDYIAMFQEIIENYLAEYEVAIKDTVLYDEESFAEIKKQYSEALDEQKEEYGSLRNKKIVGKAILVEFLINYRDGLKEFVDNMKSQLE